MGDWSVWSNNIWFKDFRKKENGEDGQGDAEENQNDFADYLKFFLGEIWKDDPDLVQNMAGIKLDDYDISKAGCGGFELPWLIGSCNGYWNPKEDKFQVGLCRLSQVMRENPYSNGAKANWKNKRIVYQSSSIGTLSVSFLASIISKKN